MWKWLRNIVLLAIVLAGALKLGAWYAVSHDAQRVVDALAPYAEVKYTGLAAGLDGSVTLSGVSVAPKGSHRIYHADSAAFDSPGLVWLLRHALLHENDLPAQFGISIAGLTLPPEPWLDPQWLDPATFAVFPTAGCTSRLDANDYRRMGIDTKTPSRERFEYRYDAAQHSLVATLSLSAPGFAALTLEADLSRFEPAVLLGSDFWKKTHVDQLSVRYADDGFMQRRNRYCGDRENLGPAQFADHHLEAVRALLQQSHIEPGEEVMKLYRTLVVQGGQASLLSLPNPGFSPGAWDAASREDLLRQLNVTARYQERPPIMLRLVFTAPSVPAAPAPSEAALANAAPAAPPPVAATPIETATQEVALQEKPAAAIVAIETKPVVATAPAPEPAPKTPPISTSKAEPMNYLDRAEAKLAPLIVEAPAPEPPQQPAAPFDAFGASAPGPSDSTQALIWKPGVIEQLPETAPLKQDFSVIDFSSLPQLTGRHVRLLTFGGKQIEGFVASADGRGLQLRIDRGGGSALIAINRDSVSQVQLLQW